MPEAVIVATDNSIILSTGLSERVHIVRAPTDPIVGALQAEEARSAAETEAPAADTAKPAAQPEAPAPAPQ